MKPKRSYHHGNLKQALVEAALELTRAVGSEGFTLRQVAARAGVHYTALYRHFRNKDDLLAAVAAEGYDYLSESVMKSGAAAKTSLERLRLGCNGMIQFALRYPEHFRTIFDAPRRYEYQKTNEAGERTFSILIEGIKQCQAEGTIRQGNPRMLALICLAIQVGISKLAITKRLPSSNDVEVAAISQMAIDAVTRGLAPEPQATKPPPKKRPK